MPGKWEECGGRERGVQKNVPLSSTAILQKDWSQDKRVFVQAALSYLASSSGCLFLLFQRRARTMAI